MQMISNGAKNFTYNQNQILRARRGNLIWFYAKRGEKIEGSIITSMHISKMKGLEDNPVVTPADVDSLSNRVLLEKTDHRTSIDLLQSKEGLHPIIYLYNSQREYFPNYIKDIMTKLRNGHINVLAANNGVNPIELPNLYLEKDDVLKCFTAMVNARIKASKWFSLPIRLCNLENDFYHLREGWGLIDFNLYNGEVRAPQLTVPTKTVGWEDRTFDGENHHEIISLDKSHVVLRVYFIKNDTHVFMKTSDDIEYKLGTRLEDKLLHELSDYIKEPKDVGKTNLGWEGSVSGQRDCWSPTSKGVTLS